MPRRWIAIGAAALLGSLAVAGWMAPRQPNPVMLIPTTGVVRLIRLARNGPLSRVYRADDWRLIQSDRNPR